MAAVGTVSYGVYLWHWFVARIIGSAGWSFDAGAGPGVAWLSTLGVLLAATLPLAVGSWLLIERPAIRGAAEWIARGRAQKVIERGNRRHVDAATRSATL